MTEMDEDEILRKDEKEDSDDISVIVQYRSKTSWTNREFDLNTMIERE